MLMTGLIYKQQIMKHNMQVNQQSFEDYKEDYLAAGKIWKRKSEIEWTSRYPKDWKEFNFCMLKGIDLL
ncbi:hypothetical protein [Peribacillus kribbensis]|uniref:hypothetical protein n=1 Tax=Peribacillus kribbensis TaxID=356658 RepID=UPI00040DD34D|nr:hypothetical protein [Peribacillus kribbensis]